MVTKEVQLTEKHVEGFIAAQKKMAAAKEAEFEAIAKAHGFANLGELGPLAALLRRPVIGRKTTSCVDWAAWPGAYSSAPIPQREGPVAQR